MIGPAPWQADFRTGTRLTLVALPRLRETQPKHQQCTMLCYSIHVSPQTKQRGAENVNQAADNDTDAPRPKRFARLRSFFSACDGALVLLGLWRFGLNKAFSSQ